MDKIRRVQKATTGNLMQQYVKNVMKNKKKKVKKELEHRFRDILYSKIN